MGRDGAPDFFWRCIHGVAVVASSLPEKVAASGRKRRKHRDYGTRPLGRGVRAERVAHVLSLCLPVSTYRHQQSLVLPVAESLTFLGHGYSGGVRSYRRLLDSGSVQQYQVVMHHAACVSKIMCCVLLCSTADVGTPLPQQHPRLLLVAVAIYCTRYIFPLFRVYTCMFPH